METIYIKRVGEVRKNKQELESKLKVKIRIVKGNVSFSGDSMDEFGAKQVLEAIAFGYSAMKALRLLKEDFVFKRMHIHDYTKRNLKDIKSRLIGTHGRTRKLISKISECDVLVGDGDVGIIGHVEDVENTENAIVNLIKGSKQSNTYRYLEKMNRLKRNSNPIKKRKEESL